MKKGKAILISSFEKGKPIHKKNTGDGVKSQHKGLMTRAKKRKARKTKKSR